MTPPEKAPPTLPQRGSPLALTTAALCALAWTACAPAPVPPKPPPPPVATAPSPPPPPASARPLPASTPLDPEPDPPPPALAEPLPALTRTFQAVSLPGVKNAITSISGRGPNDLWLIISEIVDDHRYESGVIYQYDGKKLKSRGHPCLYANWIGVEAGKGVAAASLSRAWSRGVRPQFWATMTTDGNWHCDYADEGFSSGVIQSVGDKVFQLTCTETRKCGLQIVGGPAVAFPSIMGNEEPPHEGDIPPYSAIYMTAAADGFLVHEHEDGRDWLWRYNGVTWRPLAPITDGMSAISLWGDSLGNAWILLRSSNLKDDEPAGSVLRWDGKKLSYLAVPASFQASMIRATGPDDVWMIGPEGRLYQWDGKALHQGKAPMDVLDAWGSSKDGDLWLAGQTFTSKKYEEGEGRLAHTGPREIEGKASGKGAKK